MGGDIDMGYIPQVNKDIWPLNKLKTEGSLAGYGNAFHPKDFGVDGDTLRCAAPPHELYEGLSEPEQARAKAAEEYLLGFAES